MKQWIVAVALAALTGCQKTAEVNCVGAFDGGFNCIAKNTATMAGAADVCWTVRLTCAGGARPYVRACQTVQPGASTARMIPPSDVSGASECDRVIAMSIDDVTVK